MAGVNSTSFATPGVEVSIQNNTTYSPTLQGTVYAGIFTNNRGPAYRYYTSTSELNSWCGAEDPAVSMGLGSVYDLLSQSQNVLGVRILKPYNGTSGDAYAYAVYTTAGWSTITNPTYDYLADPQDYTFQNDECFLIYSVGPGTYYNNCSVKVTKNTVESGYNVQVYDITNVLVENFYVTFDINANGTDAQTFAEASINGISKYIGIRVNYDYFLSNNTGVLPNAYFLNTYPSSGVNSILNWNITSGNSFYNYTSTNDYLGNMYIACGSIESPTGTAFNTSVLQYNSSVNTWLQLPNTNNQFTFTQSGLLPETTTVFSTANSGTIYSFIRSGMVDNLVNTLSATSGAVISSLAYDATFTGKTVVIQRVGAVWQVVVDGGAPDNLPAINGVYSTGGLSFNYVGLTPVATGLVSFVANRLHCLVYGLSNYKYNDLGLISLGGFLTSPNIHITSGITLADGNLLLTGYNDLTNLLSFYYFNVSQNSLVEYVTTVNSTIQNKLFIQNNQIYMTGGYDLVTTTVDKYVYAITYNLTVNNTVLFVSISPLMQTPATNGFIGAAVGMAGTFLYSYGGSTTTNTSYTGDFVILDLAANTVPVWQQLAPYATYSNSTTTAYLFNGNAIVGSKGMVSALGSIANTFAGQLNGSVIVNSSLLGEQKLALGLDNQVVTDSVVINTLAQLYDKTQFTDIDVLVDSGFNSPAVSLAIDALMVSRKQGVGILSMPRSYERSEDACVLYRQSLNINDGYTFLCTPGEYVRVNSYTGNYDLFPISGAVGADFCKQDNANGPWQSPAGVANGLLNVVVKLPPAIVGTPLTVPYKEITYLNSDLLGANQVNIVGKYSTMFPGYYLKNDQVLDSFKSLLQAVSIKRLVLYVANNAGQMAEQFLFEPNNSSTRTKAYTLYDDWLAQLLSKPGAIYQYKVVCDSTNNTPLLVNQGILQIDLIIYPQVPIRGILINVIANKVDNTVSITTATTTSSTGGQ